MWLLTEWLLDSMSVILPNEPTLRQSDVRAAMLSARYQATYGNVPGAEMRSQMVVQYTGSQREGLVSLAMRWALCVNEISALSGNLVTARAAMLQAPALVHCRQAAGDCIVATDVCRRESIRLSLRSWSL